MSRKPCCVGEGLKKGAWTTEEDKKLISYLQEHGEGGWRDIPQKAGLKRCGKSCRLRWANYLKPDIKRGEFSYEEEQIIIMLHASRGNKWSVIARHLPRRTDNEVKNYWNTHLKKRLIDQGIDPVTHKPLISNPNPETPKTSGLQGDDDDDSNPSNQDELSQSDSMSPKPLPPSSNSCNVQEISSSDGYLMCKKRCFKRSSSMSKLLNKVANRAASIGNILSASMERTLISSTPLSSSFNDEFSESSQFQMEEFDPFSQLSEDIIDDKKEEFGLNIDLNNSAYDFSQFLEEFSNNEGEEADDKKEEFGLNIDLNNSAYDFSQFLEEFSNNEGEEAENVGGYSQDLLMTDVSSTSVDEDNLTGWSNCLVDHSGFDFLSVMELTG